MEKARILRETKMPNCETRQTTDRQRLLVATSVFVHKYVILHGRYRHPKLV
jgi:hypothetical protein